MNKKGFTLIELLAVIVILGVILVIAIPSISAAILNSRKNSYVATANEFVDGLRMMTLTDPTLLPSGTDSTCKSLSQIKLEKGSSTKSPFGKDYTNDSEVCVAYNSTTSEYDYSVCLVDTGGNSICNIATESGGEGETTYTPVDIKTVTKDLVIVGGIIPEQEPEPEPEPESTKLIPVMTSNTAPSGTAFASSNYSGVSPYFAFRRQYNPNQAGSLINNVLVGAFVWANAETVANAYVAYDFGINNTKHITSVEVYPSFYFCGTTVSVTLKIQGSNDGTNWTDISSSDTIVNSTGYVSSGAQISYANITCNSSNTYRYVRVKPTYFNGGATYIHYSANPSVYMAQIDMYGY